MQEVPGVGGDPGAAKKIFRLPPVAAEAGKQTRRIMNESIRRVPEPAPPFHTTREVCALVGDVPESLVQDAVRRRLIPPPRVVGGIRLWTAREIECLREVLDERAARRSAREGSRAAGIRRTQGGAS